MLLKDFITDSVDGLSSVYGTEEARSVVLMLCEDVLGTRNYTHIVEPDYTVDKSKEPALMSAIARLKTGEPVQYVLGHAEFCGYRFKVGPSVLIPRPETEQLCRIALESISRRGRMRSAFGDSEVKVLDLCTGSGCIAWTIALSAPGAKVLAIDISEEALDMARNQDFKSLLKQTGAVMPEFMQSDVLSQEHGDQIPEGVMQWGHFDVVVSNPPYVRESEKAFMRQNVLGFEPGQALFVPDDDPLRFYRAVALWAEACLADGGAGFVEINEALGEETRKLFVERGFSNVEVIKDFNSKNRFVRFIK